VGTFGMLSRLLRGEHVPIFSFLLIFSDLLSILTGLRLHTQAVLARREIANSRLD